MSISSAGLRARTSDDIEADLQTRHSHTAALALVACRFDEESAWRLLAACYRDEVQDTSSRSVIDVWARGLRIRRRRAVINAWRHFLLLDWDPFEGREVDFKGDEHPKKVRWNLLQLEEMERIMVVLVLHNGVTVRDGAAVLGCGESDARSAYERGKEALATALELRKGDKCDLIARLRAELAAAMSGIEIPAFGFMWTRAKTDRRERALKFVLGTIGVAALIFAAVMITLGILHLKDEPAAQKPGYSIPAERFFDETK